MPQDFQSSQQDIDDAVAVALLQERMKSIEKALEAQAVETASLKKDRDSALRWGIVILGSSVLSMAAWIFKLISVKAGI